MRYEEEILIDYLKKYHISELERILHELSQLVHRPTTVTWNCVFGCLIVSVGKVKENVGEIKKDGRELEIEQAAILKNYKLPTMRIGFEQGAKWADKHPRRGLVDIEKACEWWTEELITPSMTQEEQRWCKRKVNAFRKAMEGGENENT